MWRGGVCMRLSGVRLLPRRRRVCPGRQSLWCPHNFAARSERAPATRTLCWLKERSNQRERAQYEFARLYARSASALDTHLTRYGHEFRLRRGAPRLGYDTRSATPLASVQTQALPDQSDLCARTENARAHKPKDSHSGPLSLVTFFLGQHKESDRLPGRDPAPTRQEKKQP